jgi:DNA replication and repair protein RecF
MAISQLSLTDFRNLKSTTLDLDRRFNLVSGDNGSGKTSLLEAIYVLCQAQSFRTHQLKQCIAHDKAGFLLFGRFEGYKAGVARHKDKINIVNADSFVLIDGAPARRRAFLDWCLFHVEPDYAEYWRLFQHALKQRNRLLKSRQDLKLLDYWDLQLVSPSNELARMREDYTAKLQVLIKQQFQALLVDIPLSIEYRPGWKKGETQEQCLERQREQDIRLGFTGSGIHRDDLELKTQGRKVGEVLSRGQSKRVCLVLLLAVLKIVNEASQSPVILLIDDLHSELDSMAQNLVYKMLLEMNVQLFISNIEQHIPEAFAAKEFKMFHVEHGTIKPRNFS